MAELNKTYDPAAVEAFAGRLLGMYTGGMLTFMVDIGHRTGLLEAAAQGHATSEELARRCGLEERYVREWLEHHAASGLLEVDDQAAAQRIHQMLFDEPAGGAGAPAARAAHAR